MLLTKQWKMTKIFVHSKLHSYSISPSLRTNPQWQVQRLRIFKRQNYSSKLEWYKGRFVNIKKFLPSPSALDAFHEILTELKSFLPFFLFIYFRYYGVTPPAFLCFEYQFRLFKILKEIVGCLTRNLLLLHFNFCLFGFCLNL